MRKLYHEYFHIPKDGKIREKVMLARVATTVLIVVLCLAAMGFTAYAYFSADLTSSPNTLTAASFDIEVSIAEADGGPVAVNASKAKLTANKTYEVTLKHNGTAKTGYAIVTADHFEGEYYTTQLVKDKNEVITFSITPDTDTTVTFLAYWGTSSYFTEYEQLGDAYVNPFFIVGGETIVLAAKADSEPTEEETSTDTKDEKEPSTEATKPSAPAESATSEPVRPEESTDKPSGPMENTASEPSVPSEGNTSEPTEPEEPSASEVSDPAEATDPTEPEDHPAEPETSGDGSIGQSEPEAEPSEGTDAPIDGSVTEPSDEPVTEPGE